MLDSQGYLPAQAFSNFSSGEDYSALMQQPMNTPVRFEAMPAQAQPMAQRYDATQLYNCFLSWEQAKTAEIQEAFIASRYYHGKQWTDAEIRELKKRRQPVTTKNRIKRKVDFLVGVEQRLRRDPKCYPRTPAAEQAAQVATASLRSVEDETRWQKIASAAAKDGLIRGIGVVYQGARLVNGKPEIWKSHIQSDRFFYDPCSEALDFEDARFMGEWQWLDIDQAIELLPFAEEMISTMALTDSWGMQAALPQEFAKFRNRQTWIDIKRRIINITSIWYKCRGQWMFDYLVGPISLCPEGYDCASPYVDEHGTSQQPYEAWSPYIDESGVRYGVIRDMISLQDGINKRSSKMLHMLTVRQTMAEKGAVDDVEKVKTEMARPDGHVEYNKGFTFEVVDQSVQTQGQFELLQEDKAEIENLGPNPGLIGRGVEDQSGRAILAQQNSGMTELSPVFENLREWKLSVYHKDWNLIRQFWTGERYIRVTSDPRSVEFLAINRLVEDPMTGQAHMENAVVEMDVDVILDEGPDTVTMREEIIQSIGNRPDVPLELIIELSSLPDKEFLQKRLSEARQPPPELIAMQQRMGALEEMLKAAQVDKTVADANAQNANVMKLLADIAAPKPASAPGGAAKPGVKPANGKASAKPAALQAPAAPPRDVGDISSDLVITSQLMQELFPMHYREPTFVEMQMHAGAPGGGPQQPQPNAMMGGEQPGPEGGPIDDAQGGPMPNPMIAQEPQLGGPGGLPLGPGVGA